MIIVCHKRKKAYSTTGEKLPFECVVTSPDGEVHECCLVREKHNGRLFLAYFDIHTKKLVVTMHKAIKERWKVEYR